MPNNNGTCTANQCKGNWNGGHAYGTNLDVTEKRVLIEYLKTF